MPKPYFEALEEGNLFELQVGEAWHFNLPKAMHPTGLATAMKPVDLGRASSFIEFNQLERTFDIKEGKTTSQNVGTYPIILQLIDSNGVSSAPFTIIVTIFDTAAQDTENNE